MATLAELVANVAKIRGFIGVYLDVPELNEKQKNALKVDLVQLDRNLDALASYAEPAPAVAQRVAEPVDPAMPPPPPDDVPPYQRSQTVFGPWASAWLADNFDDSTSLVPQIVSAKAEEQGVLAAVTAAGLLGYPNQPLANADFRWYTGFSWEATDDGRAISRVWINGKLVAEVEGVDAFGLALANGIEG